MNKGYSYVTAVLIAVVLSVFVTEAPGVGIARSWTGAINNDWFNGGNWNPAGVPADNDTLTVPSALVTPQTALTVGADSGGSINVFTPQGKADFNVLVIGYYAAGVMNITLGGDVTTSVRGVIGGAGASAGTVNVHGTGSTWNNASDLYIANFGDAELLVQNGGKVTSDFSRISNWSGSSGSATVTGGGSTWTTGELIVGNEASGTLTITDGGLVSSSMATIGNEASATNAWVKIAGAGSEWSIAGALAVGVAGTGTLTAGGGGKARADATLSVGSVGTVNLNSGGLIVTDSVSLSGGAVFNANVGSTLRTNRLQGFGNAALFGGNLQFGNFRGATDGAHTVSTGQIFDVDQEFIVGYNAPSVFTQTGGAVTAESEILGYSSTGTYNQSDGTHEITTYLIAQGSVGSYTLSGGSLTVYDEHLGFENTGVFNQTGGMHQVNDDLFLGNQPGGTGTYNLSGGTLTVLNEIVGFNLGTGIFNQTGGTHNVTGGATLYLGVGTNGIYTLDAGNLNTNEVSIASGGSGTFIQNGGTHNVTGRMYVGHNNIDPEIGRYELHGGTLAAGEREYVGFHSVGEFLQTGGTHIVQTALYVGTHDALAGTGSYEMTGGTLDVTGYEMVGTGAVGVFTQSDGMHTVQNKLVVGMGSLDTGVGHGTYNLSASGILNSNADVYIGDGNSELALVGTGLFNQSGGTHTVGENLYVGHLHKGGGVNGTYNLSDGTLDVGDHVYVGYEGNGEFNQSGGGQTTTGQLVVGYHADAAGTVNLDGGTMTASISESIGNYGTAEFNQTDGINDVGISLTLGAGAGGSGAYNLGGGTLSAGNVYVGSYGTGLFTQTAGTHAIGGTLQIGAVNYEGSGGTYDLQDGDLSVTDEDIGEDGIGAFTQSGGTHTVSGTLTISTDQGANGSYELSGGNLSAATEYIGYGDAGSFTQTGGTHTVTGDLYMAHDWNPSTSTCALGPAGTLSVGNDEYVGYEGAAEFTQTGGTHDIGGDLILGWNVDGFCSYDLSGAPGVLTVGGDERVGELTFADFTQSDGTHTVTGQLIVANAGAEASFTLSGGALSAGSEIIGRRGVGTFNQTGGTNTVAATLTIVDLSEEEEGGEGGGGVQGTYNLQGGDLIAVTVDNNDTVNQSGGTLDAGTFNNNDTVNQSGGTLDTGTFNNAGTFNHTGGTMTADTFNNTSFPTTYVHDPAVFEADTVNNNSDFHQYGGTVRGKTTLMGTFNNNGSFYMYGGTFEDYLVNQGYVYYSGGTFNGIFEHWNGATFDRNADFTAEGGIINYGSLTSSPGQQLNANGLGIQNFGEFYLNGGTCAASTFTNDFGAYFEAYGTLDADLVNNGTLETGGMFIVTGTTTNMGQVRIESTEHLRATGGMTSTGIVEMEGGSIGGPGALVNQPGGVIRGFGGVSASTTNDGGVIHATGTQLTFTDLSGGNVNGGEFRIADGSRLQIATPLASSGTIVMEGENAELLGGQIASTGTLSGAGRVSNIFLNDGVVRATGGTLTLSGAGNTNTISGRFEVQDGASVVISQGLAVNAGTIALTGGTFDNNARPMTNTGSILGRGVVATGGLANDGLMAFADGDTDIFGDVVNNDTINVTECTTTFFGDVTNAAGATIKNTDGTVRFLGDFIDNGAYVSDPADNYFIDISVGATGYFIGGEGDRFLVAGDFDNASTASSVWGTTEAELVFLADAHTVELPGADMGTTYAGMDDNFAWGILRLVENGSLTLADGNAAPGGAMYVTALILEGGLTQIASIADNGFSIYYDPASSDNDYLDAQAFPLPGGGQIAPVPEPATLSLLALGGLVLIRRRKRGGIN